MQVVRAEHCLTPGGWRSPAYLSIDARGFVTAIEDEGHEETRLSGVVIPGVANLHSHAFQRAMVGATEHADPGQVDSFWTWRTRMYALAHAVTPDDLFAIAEMLFLEMLEAGMTGVGEFHYLHHGPGGVPYDDPAENSARLLAAARSVGIAITILPVLYRYGGFGVPALERQRRFTSDGVPAFLRLVERATEAARSDPLARVGIAPHSLRAVGRPELVEAIDGIDRALPIHIHVAEQRLEVEEAIAALGARPIRWLLDEIGLDARWCLVHATHADPDELASVAASGAVAGLCPTTEANLGDGIFPAPAYAAANGRFGIGSDSHVSVDIAEELRLLEYGQRLIHERRNLLKDEQGRVGRHLLEQAARGGAQALAQPAGAIAPGCRADLVALDLDHPRLVGRTLDGAIDAWIFGAAKGAIREVWVAGKRVVTDGLHADREAVMARYRTVARRLAG